MIIAVFIASSVRTVVELPKWYHRSSSTQSLGRRLG